MRLFPTRLAALLLTCMLVVSSLPAEEPTLDAILATMPEADTELVWDQGQALTALGDGVRETLLERIGDAPPATRLAMAYALMRLGEQRPAVLALVDMIAAEEAPLSRKIEAVEVMGALGGSYAANTLRATLVNKELPELVRLEAAKNLWTLTQGAQAQDALMTMKTESPSARIRAEAALAIARGGQYDLVGADIRELAGMPGALGEQARTLVAFHEKLGARVEGDAFVQELVGEILQKVEQAYAYDPEDEAAKEKLQPQNLATSAARAMVQNLDPFNDYLDEKSYQEMLDQMQAEYGGIGAYVGMRNGFFTILTPMYGKPAFEAGLRSGDVITQIDGDDIAHLELGPIVERLKGKPGTIVTVRVMRQGWIDARDIDVRRDQITMPMTFSQMLPGGIGYIRLNGFQEDPFRRVSTSGELRQALREFKKADAKGVILDMRNNPGGLLSEAVAVSENFIERGKLIVSSRGKIRPRQDYHSRIIGRPVYEGPLVALVNGGSASASEIVAGALRDHQRATLVGEKTYGKGSVQMLLPVQATGGATRLKLTIAKYYLPDGESIHGRDKGIKPHVEVAEPELSAAEATARWEIFDSRKVHEWVEANWEAHGDVYRELLEYDGEDVTRYPGHEELRELLTEAFPKYRITDDVLRQELRQTIFAHLRDRLGDETHPVDVQASDVLQRAILVLGEQMEGGLPDVPLYNSFRHKFDDPETQDALAAKDATPETSPEPVSQER